MKTVKIARCKYNPEKLQVTLNATEEEIKDVVAFLREEYDDILTEDLKTSDGQIIGAPTGTTTASGGNYSGEEDDRYEEAREIIAVNNHIDFSESIIQ